MEKIVGKLTKEQLYRWKSSMYEYLVKEKEFESESRALGMMERDCEIARLKCALFKAQVQGKKETASSYKVRYEACLEELNQETGFKLKDNVIDEVSLEVRELEK